jgi:hypothetical protein
MARGGTRDAQFEQLSFTQIRDRVLGTGQFSSEELDRFIALFGNPDFVWMGPVLMSVWGRRPTG